MKSDLKTGMVVQYRNGEKRLVLLGTKFGDILVSPIAQDKTNSWNDLESYTDDLKCPEDGSLDLVCVYSPKHPNLITSMRRGVIIWERNGRSRMTLKEIEQELGYEVEIIEEI